MAAKTEARVLELRRVRPHWAPPASATSSAREGVEPLPSLSGIYRALLRHGLVERHARRKDAAHLQALGRPMELWQLDVVGGVLIADGTDAKVLTGVDDHSRYCVCCGVMARARTCGLSLSLELL
jgi:hypothetical protein